jgi:WD40 repeat protein
MPAHRFAPQASVLSHDPDSVTCVSFSADGKLLATGSDNNNAYTWDVYAILRETGLDEILLDVNVS